MPNDVGLDIREQAREAPETEPRPQLETAARDYPIYVPWVRPASGTYAWSYWIRHPRGGLEGNGAEAARGPTLPGPSYPFWLQREELRLDVDGRYPQMQASGTLLLGSTARAHWIAELTPLGANKWSGSIWYKDGNTGLLPYTNVEITATTSWFYTQRKATVTFSGGGAPNRTLTYRFTSPYFHNVELEFDRVQNTGAVTAIGTCDHPNRPAALPCETLTIENVFRRAGFLVKKSGGDNPIPLSAAGSDAAWSDMEMHDAMQVYWSRFANKAQWSLWVLFAALHERGSTLGGVMFDDIGPNHRQGTAIFNDSFIANAPAGDADPAAWVERMKFWTACHEMGHAFNLAHSWQKAHPPSWGNPWIPLPNEHEARSFMNYPYNVSGGQTAFFSDFEYRFSDSELLFMRHAPARFVQMGNADWFDDHGFEQSQVSPEPAFRLELRANREKPIFEFMEPVVLEMKLQNVSGQPQVVPKSVLETSDHMTVIIKKQGKAARQWAPYARYCLSADKAVVSAGAALYESLFLAVGRNGWDLAEPGVYEVRMALHVGEEDVVSNSLRLRIAPPRDYDEEFIAQDFFSDEVGRILTFDGSQVLEAGNDTLHEVAERFETRRVALHAGIALGTPLTRDYRKLDLGEGERAVTAAHADSGVFTLIDRKAREARSFLKASLIKDPSNAAETLGHIDYKHYVDRFSAWLSEEEGEAAEAAKCQDLLHETLAERQVLGSVLDEIKSRHGGYAAQAKKAGKKK